MRRLLLRLGLAGLRWAVRPQVVGQPPPGAAVLAGNHANYIDAPVVVSIDPTIRAVAKPQRMLAARIAFWLDDAIVIDGATVATAVVHLRAGGRVWLAPEGRISVAGQSAAPLRTGAARMAATAGVPIVPMLVDGTHDLRLSGWRPWRRPRLRVVFGEPLAVPPDADPAAVMAEVARDLTALSTSLSSGVG